MSWWCSWARWDMQPRIFPPLSSVLSLMCYLCEWESRHLAIVRNIISPALRRSSSVSVSVNTTIRGSVWPSGRLCSDYMAKVSKLAASDPVHNVSAGCWADFWCLYFWCERFLTHQGFSGDNPSRMLVTYALVCLSASRFQSCRSKLTVSRNVPRSQHLPELCRVNVSLSQMSWQGQMIPYGRWRSAALRLRAIDNLWHFAVWFRG